MTTTLLEIHSHASAVAAPPGLARVIASYLSVNADTRIWTLAGGLGGAVIWLLYVSAAVSSYMSEPMPAGKLGLVILLGVVLPAIGTVNMFSLDTAPDQGQ
ncbi:MAG: hypothetical protein HY329_08270 [Chloroflexi bacterium]|nr:hypothetical protein [Chloroflexota bacterium]